MGVVTYEQPMRGVAGAVISSLSLRVDNTVPSTSASHSLPPGRAEYTIGGLPGQRR